MDDATCHVERESQQPEEHKQDDQRPQHDLFLPWANLSVCPVA
jgi:hypothetical protein